MNGTFYLYQAQVAPEGVLGSQRKGTGLDLCCQSSDQADYLLPKGFQEQKVPEQATVGELEEELVMQLELDLSSYRTTSQGLDMWLRGRGCALQA